MKPGITVQIHFKASIAIGKVRYCRPVDAGFHVGIEIEAMA